MAGQALSTDINVVQGVTPGGQPSPITKTYTSSRGSFVANGTSTVVVPAPVADANKVICISCQSATTFAPIVVSVTPGTGFSITSTTGDTNIYNFKVF